MLKLIMLLTLMGGEVGPIGTEVWPPQEIVVHDTSFCLQEETNQGCRLCVADYVLSGIVIFGRDREWGKTQWRAGNNSCDVAVPVTPPVKRPEPEPTCPGDPTPPCEQGCPCVMHTGGGVIVDTDGDGVFDLFSRGE